VSGLVILALLLLVAAGLAFALPRRAAGFWQVLDFEDGVALGFFLAALSCGCGAALGELLPLLVDVVNG
jgi:hypothetical protein